MTLLAITTNHLEGKMRYFITMAALFFMILDVFAHGGHTIDSSQPHTVVEQP
jgi:hypothetical protein